jgi:hypothetical protein
VSNHPAKGKVAQLASARAKLKGEPEPVADMIDTGGLKAVLNGLDADVRGKVRAGLSAAGLPTQIPARLAPEVFDQIEAFVDKEIDTLLGAS